MAEPAPDSLIRGKQASAVNPPAGTARGRDWLPRFGHFGCAVCAACASRGRGVVWWDLAGVCRRRTTSTFSSSLGGRTWSGWSHLTPPALQKRYRPKNAAQGLVPRMQPRLRRKNPSDVCWSPCCKVKPSRKPVGSWLTGKRGCWHGNGGGLFSGRDVGMHQELCHDPKIMNNPGRMICGRGIREQQPGDPKSNKVLVCETKKRF